MHESALDPGLAGDRTALAWTRSALNLAGNVVLITRAAFTAGLPVLGVVLAIVIGPATMLVWRHGQRITPRRRAPSAGIHHQPQPLRLLTALTVSIAVVATAVTVIG